MSNRKTRLERLEMRANEQPRQKITTIEFLKPHEDGSVEVETWHLREDGSRESVEVKTYQVHTQLDRDGHPIVRAWIPANARDPIDDQIKTVITASTETDEAGS